MEQRSQRAAQSFAGLDPLSAFLFKERSPQAPQAPKTPQTPRTPQAPKTPIRDRLKFAGRDGFGQRWPTLRAHLREVESVRVAAKKPAELCNETVSEMVRLAGILTATDAKYSSKLVRRVVGSDAFMRLYKRYLDYAKQWREPPRPGRSAQHFVVHSRVAEVLAVIDQLIAEVQESDRNPELKKPAFPIYTPPEQRNEDPLWFLSDPLFPPEFSAAVLGKIRAEAAYMLMMAKRESWSEGDLVELAHERLDGVRRFAAYVAGIPGATVHMIPPEERLDVLAILERQAKANEIFLPQAERICREMVKQPEPE